MKKDTKEKLKKAGIITLWSILLSGMVVSLGFVEKQEGMLPCQSLDIDIQMSDGNFFVQHEDIRQLLRDRGDSVVGQPASSINIPAIEHLLESHAAIEEAQVYMTVDGKMKIDIIQRRPVVRIFSGDMESYYLDDKGKLMPLSDNYTANVLVVTGCTGEAYAKRYMYSMEDVEGDSALKAQTMLDDIYRLAIFIRNDAFWSAQVQEVHLNAGNELELVPRVGDHRIVFGDATAIEEKFGKLLVFYREGLYSTGWWNDYSTINLKFKDQIVCTKKS